jgi:hypothetical protein
LEGIFTRWVGELCFTWLVVVILSVVPAVLVGSAIFSVGVFAVAVLFGLPFTLFGSTTKDSRSRGVRRLMVMLAVTSLTLAYVAEVDKRIPGNAAPLALAIEFFQRETGHYPESLEALVPKYLTELPDVRFSIVQPLITYRITNGKPYLAIPSVMGDMFAQFEYDFETKNWLHQS